MKKYIVILIIVLVGVIGYLVNQNIKLTKKYETSIENVKAYDSQMSGLRTRIEYLNLQQNS